MGLDLLPGWFWQGLASACVVIGSIYLFAYWMAKERPSRGQYARFVKHRRPVVFVPDIGKWCEGGAHYVPRSTRMITPMDGREMCHPCYLLSKRPVESFLPRGAA